MSRIFHPPHPALTRIPLLTTLIALTAAAPSAPGSDAPRALIQRPRLAPGFPIIHGGGLQFVDTGIVDDARFSPPPSRDQQNERPHGPHLKPTNPATSPPATFPRGLPDPGVQVNVNADGLNILGDAANEPSMCRDPLHPNRLAIGWRQFDSQLSDFRQAGYAYSRDGGHTWTFPGVLTPGTFRSDPVLRSDTRGNFVYFSLLSTFLCDSFTSTDGGRTWAGPFPAFGGDKAWIAFDRTDGIGRDQVYAAWDDAGCCGPDCFSRSLDAGVTWSQPVAIPQPPKWGTADVAPDGAFYVAGRSWGNSSSFRLARSSNAQDAASTPSFDLSTSLPFVGSYSIATAGGPNPGGLLGQMTLVTDHSTGANRGNIYVLANINPSGPDPHDVYFSRSTDRGVTWSTPLRINDGPTGSNTWQWFGTLSIAPSGRLDVVYLDTSNDPTPGTPNQSEMRYTRSLDGGLTWSPSVVISPVFDSHLGWPIQQKLGDYYDMISDDVGASLAYAATFNGEQDIWFKRIGDFDCNGNGIGDADDIAAGTSADVNHDAIPDDCQCLADINRDFVVDLADLARLLAAFGNDAGDPNFDAQSDIDADGEVSLSDLTILLSSFGVTCP
ncbi:MAG: hypothetical protein AMXMBFR47_03420 [Planctomycetota bacterium]